MAISLNKKIRITAIEVVDIRFPTSVDLDGSDAMHPDPDYSCPYVTLHTDHPEYKGYGLTFTQGRGNELCTKASELFGRAIVDRDLNEILTDFGSFWHRMVNDGQLRWLGPEKGVVHLAAAAVINAVWDLWARIEQKPLWQLVADLTPEELVSCIDFTYITDALTPQEAVELLEGARTGYEDRLQQFRKTGLPAYTTSPGWMGYSDDKLRRLCNEAIAEGWTAVKMKVGRDINEDRRRVAIARETLGDDIRLMVDANQIWDVEEAIEWMSHLKEFNLWWIEEPTCPDDVLGHEKIREAVAPIMVATGEQCQNRVMFKQFLQAGAIDICQIDSCRLGGVNEVLAVLLLAAHHKVPVCPHAGGVGLCEYVQHLAAIDYLLIGTAPENDDLRMVEYVEHLHEHFTDPVVINNAHYRLPLKPGYSAEIKPISIARYQYPSGGYWQETL